MFARGFKLQSGGAAYNLNVGFVPDFVHIINRTKWATDATNVEFVWSKAMPNGYAYAGKCEDTATNKAIITSNGVTPYSSSSVTDISETISNITQANPAVMTVADGSGYSVDDYVRIRDVVGMTEVNGQLYKVTAVSGNSITLDLDSSGFSAYTSGGNAYNQSQEVSDDGFKGITLGTSVVGADDDILEVYCYQYDQGMKDLGDVA